MINMCRAFLSPWYEKGGMHPMDENDKPIFEGRFNLGVVSLHLPMILAKARRESKDFYEVLDYYLELIRGLHKRTYDYIGELRQLASRLGVTDNIRFIGGIYGDKKWELFRNADLFVLPTHSENFGIVVAEALACGTPVITTKGTPWDELGTENCGWWIEVGIEPIINALRAFLQLSVGNLEQMGRNGRQLVEYKYSSQKMAEDMMLLYKKSDM